MSYNTYALWAEERDEDMLAKCIERYKVQRQRLNQILDDAILRLDLLEDLKHWPAEGWDYASTRGALQDLLPHRPDAQLEAWAREDLE